MDRFKGFFSSKTVWSQLVGFLANFAVIWGIDLDPEAQAAIVSAIVALQSLAGIIFRVRAEKQVMAPMASVPKT